MPGNDEFKDLNADNLSGDTQDDIEQKVAPAGFEDIEESTTEDNNTNSTVTVQPVQFASFEDLDQVQGPQNQNLNI